MTFSLVPDGESTKVTLSHISLIIGTRWAGEGGDARGVAMTSQIKPAPAKEPAAKNDVRFPDESGEYRIARDSLLAEEIELRRHIERVAPQRRALPAGGAVNKSYAFESEPGPGNFVDRFGDKQMLAICSDMHGPRRKPPCPMGTSLRSAWDGEVRHIEQRLALVAVARPPIQRLIAFKMVRGWRDLKDRLDDSGDYTWDHVSADDADVAGCSIFTRKGSLMRHFWSGEMGSTTYEPGQDPRGAPDLMSLWTIPTRPRRVAALTGTGSSTMSQASRGVRDDLPF